MKIDVTAIEDIEITGPIGGMPMPRTPATPVIDTKVPPVTVPPTPASQSKKWQRKWGDRPDTIERRPARFNASLGGEPGDITKVNNNGA